MWQSYSNGLLVAIGLIMAIGAQNAFVLAQSLRREHHLPVAALCILCDAVLVAAGVFGLAALLGAERADQQHGVQVHVRVEQGHRQGGEQHRAQ
jgi:L-lysine exporter family protein LysE/ArgO